MKLFQTLYTIEDRLILASGRPSGFDYMRLLLALSIIVFHSWETSYGVTIVDMAYTSLWRAPVAALLPMFFSLSGFLVAGSLERTNSILRFLLFRILRIIPALAVEVLLSALILGPLLTVLPLKDYFSNSEFRSYFANILGDIHYILPGMFLNNPVPKTVNAQLWTIPYELACYGVLTFMSIAGIYKRRWFLIAALFVAYGVVLLKQNGFHPRTWSVNGETLILTFICGMILHRFRTSIPWNNELFLVSALVAICLLAIHVLDVFAAIPIAYATIYLGLLNPPHNKVLLGGDYSYGLFLYGYAIQQAISSLGIWVHEWYWNLLLALPITILSAVGSWWLIENPVLDLKRYTPFFNKRLGIK